MTACLFCGFPTLGAVRELVEGSNPVICGGCGAVQVLEVDEELEPSLRRAGTLELRELYRDPDVARFRDAFDVETIERAAEGTRKTKVKGKVRLRPGNGPTPLDRMTAHGPDYKGPPL